MALQVRPLRYGKNEERCDDAAEIAWLMAILNKDHDPPLVPSVTRRIASLLLQLQKVDRLRAMLKLYGRDSPSTGGVRLARGVKFDDPRHETANRQGGKIVWEINKTLFRYRWSPVVWFYGVDFEPLDRPDFHQTSEMDYIENFAIWVLLQKFKNGHIDRMKCCDECRTWFYAITDHQRFCKDSCRKRFASQSNEYRLKRRTYMRGYRRNQRVRDETAILLANQRQARLRP